MRLELVPRGGALAADARVLSPLVAVLAAIAIGGVIFALLGRSPVAALLSISSSR